jgi:hypothetical protein
MKGVPGHRSDISGRRAEVYSASSHVASRCWLKKSNIHLHSSRRVRKTFSLQAQFLWFNFIYDSKKAVRENLAALQPVLPAIVTAIKQEYHCPSHSRILPSSLSSYVDIIETDPSMIRLALLIIGDEVMVLSLQFEVPNSAILRSLIQTAVTASMRSSRYLTNGMSQVFWSKVMLFLS